MTAEAATFAAVLTPPGHGAIATLALWGPSAWRLVRALSRSPSLPEEPAAGHLYLSRLGTDLIDQVVIAAEQRQQVPWVEVHCHGGPAVLRMLLADLQQQGAQPCAWAELEHRSGVSALRAAATVALTATRTTRTAGILLDQLAGALDHALHQIRTAWERGERAAAEHGLAELARHTRLGRHLTTPWKVVLAGAPNVGKSSLVNALAGFQRCLVAATPGTTRDLVTTIIALDGWPVELIDTAGQHAAAGGLEAQGIQLARAASAEADLVLWLVDAATPPQWPETTSTARLVINKVDLPAAWDLTAAANALHVSATSGTGLAELCQALGRWLVPDPPPPGAAVPFTPALCDRVDEAWRCWRTEQREDAVKIVGDLLYWIGP